MTLKVESAPLAAAAPRGRPRSGVAQRAILGAFQDLLIEVGFARLRLEHVAARAGTSKATIYRRWRSKEELAIELLREQSAPRVAVTDRGSARTELIAVAMDIIGRLTAPAFGAVIRRLLCEIAGNPAVGEPFRALVINARRDEIRGVIERGIARGDVRPEADPEITTELLAGSIYFRSLFGGPLDPRFAETMVDALLAGYGVTPARPSDLAPG